MVTRHFAAAAVLGALISLGLGVLGYQLADSARQIREAGRTVTVKGLSERDVPADIAIWPIVFNEADNELSRLVASVQSKSATIVAFLKTHGFSDEEITLSSPSIFDRQAARYDAAQPNRYRYTAKTTISVYTTKVDLVRETMNRLVDLGRQGIPIGGDDYETRTNFLFTRLNELKPEMIEEATRNARQVAEKFARDSESRLGKIKQAQQGQFSIDNRDQNTPHIKKVRIVSTIEYYLAD